MARSERNARSWQNPSNWIGPRWLGLYRCAEDDRLWVRKVPRSLGWTVNLGRPAGVAMLWILIVAVLANIGGYALRG